MDTPNLRNTSMSKKYNLIFSGKVKEGSQRALVRKKLALLLKKDEKTIAKLFSGTPKIIKKDADLASCKKVQKIFSQVGALCTIEESSGRQETEQDNSAPQGDNRTANDNSGSNDLDGKLTGKDSGKTGKAVAVKRRLADSRRKGTERLEEARSSIQHDLESGDIAQLIKNRYFQYIIGLCVGLIVLLATVIFYDDNSMPIDQHNLQTLSDHIVFIEQSFTIQGLAERTGSKKEYLEYLLVKPVKETGFSFTDTLDDLVDKFLDNDLSQDEANLGKKYLLAAASERENLLHQGYIGKTLNKKLKSVSDRLATEK
jgi:hypothetical protein